MLGTEDFHDVGDGAPLAAVEQDGAEDALLGLDVLGRKVTGHFTALGGVQRFHEKKPRDANRSWMGGFRAGYQSPKGYRRSAESET